MLQLHQNWKQKTQMFLKSKIKVSVLCVINFFQLNEFFPSIVKYYWRWSESDFSRNYSFMLLYYTRDPPNQYI